jgi:hypothetical protein
MPSKQHACLPSNVRVVVPPPRTPPDQHVSSRNSVRDNSEAECAHDWPYSELLSDTLCALGCGTEYVEWSQ